MDLIPGSRPSDAPFMEWQIDFAPDGSRVTVRAWGPADLPSLLAYVEEVLAAPEWRPGLAALLDFTDLDLGTLSTRDIQRLADLHDPFAEALAQSPIAVVVARPVDFGLVRMWEAFTSHLGLAHGVFFTRVEAEAWLREA